MANRNNNKCLRVCLAVATGLLLAFAAAPRNAQAASAIESANPLEVIGDVACEAQSLDFSMNDVWGYIPESEADIEAWKEAYSKLAAKVAEITVALGSNYENLKPAFYDEVVRVLNEARELWQSGQATAEELQAKLAELNALWQEVKSIGMKVSIESATVSGIKDYTYSGKACKPTPVVVVKGKTLVAGTDYTVAYANNKNAGQATVTITAMGNYKGQLVRNFTIKKAANTFAVKGKTAKVSYADIKTKSKGLSVSKVLTYTNKGQGSKTFAKVSGNEKITVDTATGKVVVKKGLKKGTYVVEVKVRAKGDANYKASAKITVAFKIKVA